LTPVQRTASISTGFLQYRPRSAIGASESVEQGVDRGLHLRDRVRWWRFGDRQARQLFDGLDVAVSVERRAGAGAVTMIHSAFDQDAVSEMFDVHSDSPRPPEHPR